MDSTWQVLGLCKVRFEISQKEQEESELGCECCIKLKLELSETVSELKSAKKIVRILKEDLDMANSSEHNASTPTNLHRQKDQTYFQTKSSNWNKIPARIPTRKEVFCLTSKMQQITIRLK
jgi:hypothetical protein